MLIRSLLIAVGLLLLEGGGVWAQPAPADSTRVQRLTALAQDDLAAAIEGTQSLLQSLESGAPSPELADALELMVQLRLRRDGRRARAETVDLLKRAIQIRETHPESDPLALANVYRELGITRYSEGDTARALELMGRCLEIRRRELGSAHGDVGQVLYNMASVAKAAGDFGAAGVYNQEAHEVYLEVYGEGHGQLAYTLNQRGNLMGDQGFLEEARGLYEQTLEILEESVGRNHPFYVGVTSNLGDLLRKLARYDEALALLEESLAWQEEQFGPEHEELLLTLSALGVVCTEMADFGQAREHYQRYLDIAEAVYGPDHYQVGYGLNNLAILQEESGDAASALVLYERALAIKEQYAEERAWDLALALHNVGNEYLRSGAVERGGALLERSLAMREDIYGEDHPLVAQTLNGLSEALRSGEHADPARAQALADRALSIRLAAFDADHPTVARSRFLLSMLALERGELDVARENAELSLSANETSLGPQHPTVAEDLGLRAVIRERQGDLAGAIEDALRAEELGADHLRLTVRSFAERQALGYAAKRPHGLGLALSWGHRVADAATRQAIWDSLIRNRAIVLEEMMVRRSHARAVVAEQFELFDDLQTASTRLANLVIRGSGEDTEERYVDRLLVARQEKEDLERELASRSDLFRDLSERDRVGYGEVAARMREGDLLVAYARFTPAGFETEAPPESYAVLVLPAEGEPQIHDLGSSRRVDALVASWRSEIERGAFVEGRSSQEAESRALRMGDALTRQLIGPWREHLEGARRLFVVPDGSLHKVNLAALPVGGRYLLEHDLLIQTLQSERDLRATTAPPPDNGGLLGLGGASYDAQIASPSVSDSMDPVGAAQAAFRGSIASCPQFQSLEFVPLPAAGDELNDVSSLWRASGGGVATLTGDRATEAEFKRSAPGRQVLHLATHAFFLGDACGVTLASGRTVAGGGDTSIEVTGQTPLLLSGLAFAGANRRGEAPSDEDGILTAEEVASLDLRGVRWAVLSACETGGGVLRSSEGVLGLPRAFRVAGAQTVVLSLWRVEDQTTRSWMSALYRGHLGQDLEAAAAVRFAAREILSQRRERGESTHPFFWAAFIAVGS